MLGIKEYFTSIKEYLSGMLNESRYVQWSNIYYVFMLLFGICVIVGILSLLLLLIDVVAKILIAFIINF
ncbi:MAG: hypothetical protein AAFO15_00450 [Pseudomonadota bacterium]